MCNDHHLMYFNFEKNIQMRVNQPILSAYFKFFYKCVATALQGQVSVWLSMTFICKYLRGEVLKLVTKTSFNFF